MNTSKKPFNLDTYSTRGNRLKSLHAPTDIYSKQWFILLAVAGACFVDFFCMQSIWNKVCKPENIVSIYALSAACCFALDVPLSIAGYTLKRYKEGLTSRFSSTLILSLSIALFLGAFICSFIFRLETRDMSYEVQSMNMVNTIGGTTMTEQSGNNTVLIAAIFNAMIPLFTSVSCFVASYYSYHPLNDRIKTVKNALITLDANINEAKGALAEVESQEEHCKTLLVKELELFEEQLLIIGSKAEELKQNARVLLMEKLATPEDISSLTESAKNSIEKVNLEASEDKLVDNLSDKLNTSDEVNY